MSDILDFRANNPVIEFVPRIPKEMFWDECSRGVALTTCYGLVPTPEGKHTTQGRALIEGPGFKNAGNIFEQNRSLWREFMNLELTEAGVLEFARTYGLLEARQGRTQTLLQAERLEPWVMHIKDMSLAYRMWQALLSQKMGEVKKLYPATWRYGSYGFWVEHETASKLASFETGSTVLEREAPFEREAWLDLETLVSDRIAQVRPTARLSPSGMQTTLVPTNLLAGLWLQFAFEIANQPYLKCAQCKRLFKQKLNSHSDRKYCYGTRCKKAASRAALKNLQVPQPTPQPDP